MTARKKNKNTVHKVDAEATRANASNAAAAAKEADLATDELKEAGAAAQAQIPATDAAEQTAVEGLSAEALKDLVENAVEEALQKERKEAEERFLRLAAEYENFRKRSQREKEQLYHDAIGDLLKDFLPLYDNLDRALAATDATKPEELSEAEKAMAEGVRLVHKQAYEILAKIGVTEIPSKGEQFDPNLHSAVMHEENPELGSNVVAEVFQKGYQLPDRVIRHAMVKVAN